MNKIVGTIWTRSFCSINKKHFRLSIYSCHLETIVTYFITKRYSTQKHRNNANNYITFTVVLSLAPLIAALPEGIDHISCKQAQAGFIAADAQFQP